MEYIKSLMMKLPLIVLLFFPIVLIAQKSNVIQLSLKQARTSLSANGWVSLDSGWKFKTGDNPDWAKPGNDDITWQPIDIFKHAIPPKEIPANGIVWFRLHFIADSTLLQPLAMRIYQTGPSQVYLDGKLLYNLGTVSSNPDSINFFSPNYHNLAFPIVSGKEQVLAVRFVNFQQRYPLYFNSANLAFESWISPFENAENDYITLYNKTFTNRLNIGIGAAITLALLYFSLFFFFRAERVNLYFGLSVLFLVLLLIALQAASMNQGNQFNLALLLNLFSTLFLTGILLCVYMIFNHKKGWLFRALIFAGAISLLLPFFLPEDYSGDLYTLAVIICVIGVSSKHQRENKTAALILLIGFSIDLAYISVSLFSALGIVKISGLSSLAPFALLTPSLSLAIYLGYSFGITSQSLRRKLNEVEQLSVEKQQILSSQNETLEKQVKERTAALNQSLTYLKSTQAQLIQSEKMASLGVLTAGIAHEIQNPLNFVNNFSEINNELVEELKSEWSKLNGEKGSGLTEELLNDISQNNEKINHHGKRADSIVKGMLQHSRTGTGQKESTDINSLADEYLRLAYHGMRARDKSFNAIIETDFDSTIGNIKIVAPDISRVLLNLYNNAFDAMNEKMKTATTGYAPVIKVQSRRAGNNIDIIITDNGNGIPVGIIDKIFQPFFTTKPTGQGTGLGLSLSYDIVKVHNGTLQVDSVAGEYSTFTISLPV